MLTLFDIPKVKPYVISCFSYCSYNFHAPCKVLECHDEYVLLFSSKVFKCFKTLLAFLGLHVVMVIISL
jgi:hypothetical protein